MFTSTLIAALALSLRQVAGSTWPDVLSCSSPAKDVDPCCVPIQGLFVFKQRFEPDTGSDLGSWGIDGLEVLEYDTIHMLLWEVVHENLAVKPRYHPNNRIPHPSHTRRSDPCATNPASLEVKKVSFARKGNGHRVKSVKVSRRCGSVQ
jgi:hypothetical protein